MNEREELESLIAKTQEYLSSLEPNSRDYGNVLKIYTEQLNALVKMKEIEQKDDDSVRKSHTDIEVQKMRSKSDEYKANAGMAVSALSLAASIWGFTKTIESGPVTMRQLTNFIPAAKDFIKKIF